MKLTRIATPLIAVAMMTVPMMALAQSSQMGNDNNNAAWAQPTGGPEQQAAYNDGIEAAKLDALTKRPVDATKSHLYQAPPVKKDKRDAYRASFVAGYNAAVKHNATSGM